MQPNSEQRRWKKAGIWRGKGLLCVRKGREVSRKHATGTGGMATAPWDAQQAQMMTTGTTTRSSASGHGVQGEDHRTTMAPLDG